ncbi:MAG TPA: HAMP domain-containing sensor histidine kinase [Solirubrobacteraceae bacterium]|jgi:signal transduction histidine kinase|nr:HAMP domain-containing sensor histidine kinase [Solirubrobacteraceae bacterium]
MTVGGRRAPDRPRRPRRTPAPTIRLRLTALYGTVFLITGAAVLTIGYLFVRTNLRTHHSLRAELLRLGIRPVRGEFGFPPGSATGKLIHTVQSQILGGALHRLLIEYAVALVAMTAFSVVIGWLLAGRALAPLREITATARRVSGENLGERIDLRGPADELRELADTFDGMLARLDSAFASQRHFVANASHELRTPLAIMRTEVDVALADPDASAAELREMGEAIRDTVDRCERLLASLLLLARSEAATGQEEPVDLAALAADCITDLWAPAEEAQVEIHDDLEPAWTNGHPGLLERLIANLIDNGIHHNVPGGFLRIQTRALGDTVELVVANGGDPIDPARVRELVEPFRRLDRSVGGFGLGLSIVQSIARAHRGVATLIAPAAGGLEVRVTMPRLSESRATRPRPTDAVHSAQGALSADPQNPLTKS